MIRLCSSGGDKDALMPLALGPKKAPGPQQSTAHQRLLQPAGESSTPFG